MSEEKKELTVEEMLNMLKFVLEDSDLSDIVWAIRGPDLTRSEDLKEMYAKTIRIIAYQYEDPVEAVLSRITPDNLKLVLLELEEMKGSVGHYLIHVAFAFASFKNLGVIPWDVHHYIDETINMIIDLRLRLQDGEKITTEFVEKKLKPIEKMYMKLLKKYVRKKRGGSA